MANMTFGVNLIPKTNNTYSLGDSDHRWNIHSNQSIYYGVCSTAADTQIKEVTIDGITSLYNGLQVRIRFDHSQNYDGQPMLDINSLGAKGITIRGTVAASNYMWNTGEILDFVYNGTSFVGVDQTYASTTYYGQTKLLDSTSSTSTSLAATPNSVKQAYDLANTAATQNITMARLPLISRTYYPEMQVGEISTETGNNTSSTNASGKARSRSVDRIPYNEPVTITADTDYSYLILMYASDDTYSEASASWMTGSNSVPECGSYRLLVKNNNISDFTDVPNTFITVTDNLSIQERFNQLYDVQDSENVIPTASGVSF